MIYANEYVDLLENCEIARFSKESNINTNSDYENAIKIISKIDKTVMNAITTKTNSFQLDLKKVLFYISIFVFQYNFGQDFNEMFNKGNSAYNEGNFEKAISHYNSILEKGSIVVIYILIWVMHIID